MKHLLSLMAVTVLLSWSLGEIHSQASSDAIKIISITSAQPVHRGVENEFTVEVEYNLESSDEGVIGLAFNLQDPNAYAIVETKIVQSGAGTATLKARVIPVDWKDRGRFTALVNLSKHPHEEKWSPLVSDMQIISVGK